MSLRQFHALDQGISNIVFLSGILLGRNLKFSRMASTKTTLAWGMGKLCMNSGAAWVMLDISSAGQLFFSAVVSSNALGAGTLQPPAFPADPVCKGCCVGLQQAFVLVSNKCCTTSTTSCRGQRSHLEKFCIRNNTLFLSSVCLVHEKSI